MRVSDVVTFLGRFYCIMWFRDLFIDKIWQLIRHVFVSLCFFLSVSGNFPHTERKLCISG